MVLFILHKFVLQTGMCSHPVGLDVWFFGRTLHLLPYFMCANRECSGKTTHAQAHLNLCWSPMWVKESHELAQILLLFVLFEVNNTAVMSSCCPRTRDMIDKTEKKIKTAHPSRFNCKPSRHLLYYSQPSLQWRCLSPTNVTLKLNCCCNECKFRVILCICAASTDVIKIFAVIKSVVIKRVHCIN